MLRIADFRYQRLTKCVCTFISDCDDKKNRIEACKSAKAIAEPTVEFLLSSEVNKNRSRGNLFQFNKLMFCYQLPSST